MTTKGKLAATSSAALVVATWLLCGSSYATDGGGSYTGAFALLGLVAVGLTTVAAIAITEAWKGARAVVAAPAVSGLAVASVLWLALALRLRG